MTAGHRESVGYASCDGSRRIPFDSRLNLCVAWLESVITSRNSRFGASVEVIDTFFLPAIQLARMRIREWQDILEDVTERDVDPEDWRAVAGDRAGGVG